MKKYDFNLSIEHKKLKKFSIDVRIDYFICCSDFLNKDKCLKFLEDTQDPKKRTNKQKQFQTYAWDKKVIEKSEIIMNTHFIDDGSIFLGHVNLNKKDHFFILHGDDDARWFSMPPLGFFKYVTTFKHKLNSFNCNSGKIVFFSDEYIDEEFKNKKLVYEFNVIRGKYSLYSMNIDSEEFKKKYPYSNLVGALLVKD